MEITDIRMKLVDNDAKNLKAVVSITIDGAFVIHDIKIVDSKNGLFVSMPSKKDNRGEYKDICHPINTETRKSISDLVIQKYETLVSSIDEDEE